MTLRAKCNMRLLETDERRRATPGERDSRRVIGGMLVQDRDTESEDRDMMDVVAGAAPTERSGATCCSPGASPSTCARTRSCSPTTPRPSASAPGRCRASTRRGSALGKAVTPVAGAVLASDAFFPFADGVEAALDAGVRVIIQPGGAKRDDEVIAAVETGRRHDGLHRPPPLPALSCTSRADAAATATIPAVREFPTILDLVGDTPIVRLPQMQPAGGARLLAKLEYLNPGGSIKDRIGLPDDRGGRARRACCGPAARSSSRPPATPASGSRWSRRSAATAASS